MLGFVALVSLAAYLITPETAAGPAGDPLGFRVQPALPRAGADAVAGGGCRWRRRSSASPAARIAVVSRAGRRARRHGGAAAAVARAHAAGAIVIGGGASRWSRRPIALAPTGSRVARMRGRRDRGSCVLAGAAGAGYALQRHYLRGRYAYHPGVSYLAPVWALFRTVHDARVGVVGTFGGFFSYPLYGLDDSNRVTVRRPARPARIVHADRHLRSMAGPGERRPLELPHHHTRTRPVAPAGAQRLPRNAPGRHPTRPPQPVYRELALGQPIVVYRAPRSARLPAPAGKLSSVDYDYYRRSSRRPRAARDRVGPLPAARRRRRGSRRRRAHARRGAASARRSSRPRTPGKVAELDAAGLHGAMRELEAINELIGRVGSYASLRFATDTADPARGALLQLVQERATEIETLLLFFELEWAAVDDDRAEELLAADAPGPLPPPPAQRAPLPPPPALRERGEDPRREVDLEPGRLEPAVRRAGRGAAGRPSTTRS